MHYSMYCKKGEKMTKKTVSEMKNELIGRELSYMDLDNYMVQAGYYSNFDDGIAYDIKKDGNTVYVAKDSCEAEVQIFFDITIDSAEDEVEEAFCMRVTDVEKF